MTTTQRRTLDLTPDQWNEVEQALLAQVRRNRDHARAMTTTGPAWKACHDRAAAILLAVRQIQAAGAAGHDGGPVGTARYTVS